MEGEQATRSGGAGTGSITARGVWREAWSIVRRYPLATILPALVLATLAEGLTRIGESEIVDETLSNLAVAFVYYLYLAYAEELVEGIRSGSGVPSLGGLHRLLPTVSVALRMVVASSMVVGLVIAAVVGVGLAAAGAEAMGAGDLVILLVLLVIAIPVLVLLTRLSLFAPALSSERLGPLAALIRSNRLARGHFWLVFWTATLAFLLEGMVDEVLGLIGEPLGESGEWIGGSIFTGMIMPVAAITTSLAYYRILIMERQTTGSQRSA